MDNSSAPSSTVQERRIEVIGQMVSFVRVEDQVHLQQQQPLVHALYGPYPSASTSTANYSQNIRMPSHSIQYTQPFLRGPSTVARTSGSFNPQPIYYPNQRIFSNSLIDQYPLSYQQPSTSIQTNGSNQQMVNVPTDNQSRQKQSNNDGQYLHDSATVTANKTAAGSQVKFASSMKTANSTSVSYEETQMPQLSFKNMDSMAKREFLFHNQLSAQASNLKKQSTSTQDGVSAAMFIKKEEESEVKHSIIHMTKPTKTKLAHNTVGEEAVQAKKVKYEDDNSDSDYISTDSITEPGR